MKYGFVKVAAATPKIKVANTTHNGNMIRSMMKEAADEGAKVVVFPELCITGYSCGDLFLQEKLLVSAKEELMRIANFTEKIDGIFFVGLPFEIGGKLYNVTAAVSGGEVLGIVPKTYLPGYNEFYETRYFASGAGIDTEEVLPNGESVLINTDLIFCCENIPKLKISAEICEDLWNANPPSIRHALAGANVIVNLSASNETVGKREYRRNLVTGQSARLLCAYICAAAGEGESTQDVVYAGHNMIAEAGRILKESKIFTTGIIYSEIDVERLESERRKTNTFIINDTHTGVAFNLEYEE
ncbi:MAG: NAD(+) synthase, partial [Lachnospiraceae bacterium]|nr:NAD(+) synthase [Lachnospiraceae bacterium]